MTAEDHLKIAYGELLKAAEAVKSDAAQLRTDLTNAKQSITLQLTQLQEQLRVMTQQQGQTNDQVQQQQLNKRIGEVQRQITNKRHELDEEIRRMSQLIYQREQDSQAIQNQARTVAP